MRASGTAIPPRSARRSSGSAALGYVERRYPGTRTRIDSETEISPVTSTREGLYLAASRRDEPVAQGADRADAEPVLSDLSRRRDHGGCRTALPRAQRVSALRGRSARARRRDACAGVDPLSVLAVEPRRQRDRRRGHAARDRSGAAAQLPRGLRRVLRRALRRGPARRRARRARRDGRLGALARQRARAAFAVEALERGGDAVGIRRGCERRDGGTQSRSPQRDGLHAAAVARGGDGAVVGGHARAGDARTALRHGRTPRIGCWAGIRAITGRRAGFSCGCAREMASS